MSFNESSFKKLGFRPKNGEKNVLTASAEICPYEYITVELEVRGQDVYFMNLEVQGRKADEVRRQYLSSYSLAEIHQLFTAF